MSWLWKNYKPNARYAVAWEPDIPALEIADGAKGKVNVIPRFLKIFLPLYSADLSEQDKAELENLLLHFLALQDQENGINTRDVQARILAREIKNGLWGEENSKSWPLFNSSEQQKISSLLYIQLRSGMPQLEAALKAFFKHSIVWKIKAQSKLSLGIPMRYSHEAERRLKLLLNLFLPLGIELEILWGKAPCILDLPEARFDTSVLA